MKRISKISFSWLHLYLFALVFATTVAFLSGIVPPSVPTLTLLFSIALLIYSGKKCDCDESDKSDLFCVIVGFIASYYDRGDLTIDFVAGRTGIPQREIDTVVRIEMGLTFDEYVRELRCLEADRLLRKRDRSVEDIYEHVGYSSASDLLVDLELWNKQGSRL